MLHAHGSHANVLIAMRILHCDINLGLSERRTPSLPGRTASLSRSPLETTGKTGSRPGLEPGFFLLAIFPLWTKRAIN